MLVDTTLDQPDMAVSQIASDNEAGGDEAAKALAELIGGKGKVFVVNVKPGISTTDPREKGFVAARRRPGSTTWAASTPTTSPRRRPRRPRRRCAKNPDLAGIFATNLFSAEGAASGVREAGAKVKIVAFDAGPKQVKDLEEGTVQALIAQKPADIGAQGVEQAYNALDGQADHEEDRHRVHVDHQGQPRRQPGRALQAVLLIERCRGAPPGAPR